MNLDDLRAVQVDERGTDSLQALPDSFYRDVATYVEELRERRASAAERAENPFDSEEVRRLTDEIETAEEVVEAVYERRVGKVVKRASLAAAGMPADDVGLTAEERTLFNRLVDEIEANRQQVLDVLDGSGGSDAFRGSSEGTPGESDESMLAADAAMGRDTEPDDPPIPPEALGDESAEEVSGETSDGAAPEGSGAHRTGEVADDSASGMAGGETERVTLRITRDVGEVFGVDERVYDLGEEDVVTLPAANAGPLLERDAAERLE